MSFETSVGTRGGRSPKGPFVRVVNKIVAPMIRRKGQFGGMNALVLTTVGRKSGQERANPLAWFPGPDGSWLIVASAPPEPVASAPPDSPGSVSWLLSSESELQLATAVISESSAQGRPIPWVQSRLALMRGS